MAELVLRLRKELSERGLDARADTLGWHLRHHHGVRLSRETIHRIPTRAGAVIPEPAVNGRLHHLGIGRTHARTHVLILVTTSTSASSTPPPENSSANWSSTPAASTNPPADHQDQPANTPERQRVNPQIVGSPVADVLRHHKAEGVGFEPTMTVTRHTGFQDQRTRPLCEPSRRRGRRSSRIAQPVGPERECGGGWRPVGSGQADGPPWGTDGGESNVSVVRGHRTHRPVGTLTF